MSNLALSLSLSLSLSFFISLFLSPVHQSFSGLYSQKNTSLSSVSLLFSQQSQIVLHRTKHKIILPPYSVLSYYLSNLTVLFRTTLNVKLQTYHMSNELIDNFKNQMLYNLNLQRRLKFKPWSKSQFKPPTCKV